MKYLELTEFTPPAGQEWMPTAYPGIGNYLLPSGMIVVVYQVATTSAPITVFINPGLKVKDAAPSSGQGIDVHRLLDQMINLAK